MSTAAPGRARPAATTRWPRSIRRRVTALRGPIAAGPAQLLLTLLQRLPDVAELTTPGSGSARPRRHGQSAITP